MCLFSPSSFSSQKVQEVPYSSFFIKSKAWTEKPKPKLKVIKTQYSDIFFYHFKKTQIIATNIGNILKYHDIIKNCYFPDNITAISKLGSFPYNLSLLMIFPEISRYCRGHYFENRNHNAYHSRSSFFGDFCQIVPAFYHICLSEHV